MTNDDWERRAVALAAQLDQAAAELRGLVADIRKDSLDEGPHPEEGDDERAEP
jgi:hypothetical protein